MDLFNRIRRKPKLIAQRRNRILLWAYDANSRCQFYLKIYWKLFLGKNDEAVILVNSLLPKKGRLWAILLLAIPILKELSKP
jgi:hypothetical protein